MIRIPPSSQSLPCPECGRILNIPPGTGKKIIGCKGCLHMYSFDPKAGTLESRGMLQPTQPPKPREKFLFPKILAVLLLCAALCYLALHGLPTFHETPPPPPPVDSPDSVFEDVQKQLKSLAE